MLDFLSNFLGYKPPPWIRLVIFCMFFLIILLILWNQYDQRYHFTPMLRYGSFFENTAIPEIKSVERKIYPGSGFDGQFYANIAIDPLLQHDGLSQTMDRPQYRTRRILLSAIAYLLGGLNPHNTINIYAVLNFVFWFFFLLLLFIVFPPVTIQHYCIHTAILFTAGIYESLTFALTDLPAIFFLTCAIVVPFFRFPLFTAAVLTRETMIFCAPVFIFMKGTNIKDIKKSILNLILALIPVTGWYVYAAWRMPEEVIVSGVYSFPFFSMLHRLASTIHHWPENYHPTQLLYFLTAFSMTVQMVYFLVRKNLNNPLWQAGLIFSILFSVMGKGPWMEYYWILRINLAMTIFFNLLLLKDSPREFIRWFPAGNIGCLILRITL